MKGCIEQSCSHGCRLAASRAGWSQPMAHLGIMCWPCASVVAATITVIDIVMRMMKWDFLGFPPSK